MDNRERKKILIVEDEMVIVMDLQSALEQFGYEVSGQISRGEDVITTIEQCKPDLILMDVKLEGEIDGIETAQMVYDYYNIPVIFLTSYSNKQIIERAKKTNPFGYIVKPFVEGELYTNIEIAFYKHEAELKLKESERKYRLLAESIQHIIIECDTAGRIVYVNQPGMEVLGVTTCELETGIYLTSFITSDEFRLIKERIDARSEKDIVSSNREYLLINKFGKRFYIEEYLSPIYSYGEVTGYRGLFIDITAKKFRENLYFLYSKLTLLYNESKVNPFELIDFLLSEFKNYFTYIEDVTFNEYHFETGKIIKYTSGEKLSRAYSTGLTEYVIESKKPLYLRGQELVKFYAAQNIPVRNPDDVCWAGFPVNFQNRPFGVFVFKSVVNQNALMASDFENLTLFFNNVNALLERLSYLKEIQESSEQYKHIVNYISAGVIQLDPELRVKFISDNLRNLLGCSKSEIMMMPVDEIYKLNRNIFEALPARFTVEVMNHNKERKQFLVFAFRLTSVHGNMNGITLLHLAL